MHVFIVLLHTEGVQTAAEEEAAHQLRCGKLVKCADFLFFFSRRAAEVPPVPARGIEPGLPAWEGALGTTRAQPPP